MEVELLNFETKKKLDKNREVSEAEFPGRALPRAMSIETFCGRYDIGRTLAYQEINAGRLIARKAGRRTVIAEEDAENWLRSLPLVEAKP